MFRNLKIKSFIKIFILLFVISLEVEAQERQIDGRNLPENYEPQKGDYIIDSFLDAFTGKYTFTDQNQYFEMNLYKKKLCVKQIIYCKDAIFGYFEFKKDGVKLISQKTVSQKNTFSGSDSFQIINAGTEKNEIQLNIKDDNKNKSLRGYLKKLRKGKYSLKISDSIERWIMTEKDKTLPGMTLPSEMILTKIE